MNKLSKTLRIHFLNLSSLLIKEPESENLEPVSDAEFYITLIMIIVSFIILGIIFNS